MSKSSKKSTKERNRLKKKARKEANMGRCGPKMDRVRKKRYVVGDAAASPPRPARKPSSRRGKRLSRKLKGMIRR